MKNIKFGIRAKMTAIIIAMGVLLSLSVGYAAYSISYREVEAHYAGLALGTAKTAAALINGDSIERYLTNGADEEYFDTFAVLQEVKSIFDLTYLYVVKPDTEVNNCVYVFDVFTENNDRDLIAELGDETGEDEVYDIVLEIYLTGNIGNNAVITNTEYGWLASAYVPVYTSDGSIAAVMGSDISMDRILYDIWVQTIQQLLMAVVIIALFMSLLLFFTRRQILRPIVSLSHHMRDFDSGEGNLREFEALNTGDELQTMAESYNRMVGDIRLYIDNLALVTADRERIATELDVATKIQASMLPCIFPAFPNRADFDIYASMLPAKEVGGDFYDFFLTDENTLAVVIADVSGKGVPAALFMVIAKTLIKNNAQNGKPPKEVFETVNDLLCENNDAGMFVTAFMGILDIPTGRFTYVSAGHNPPLIKRAGGFYEWLPTKPCFILAGIEDMTYEQDEITLNKGDMLYMYTDGVTEATNRQYALFTEPKLLEVANKYKSNEIKDFLTNIKNEIDLFSDGAEQADDITMLILKISGGIQ